MATRRSTRLQATRSASHSATLAPAAKRCRRNFLAYFPEGFRDPDYVASEREYKWIAHKRWKELMPPARFTEALVDGEARELAADATRIESRTNLLFPFEEMALRDAVKSAQGARSPSSSTRCCTAAAR
jgi:hypothetical protein